MNAAQARAELEKMGLSAFDVDGKEVWAESQQAANDKVARDNHVQTVHAQMELISQAIDASDDTVTAQILEDAYNKMLDYVVTI